MAPEGCFEPFSRDFVKGLALWGHQPGEKAPRPWCPTATGGLAAFPPQGQGLGEQVLAEPSMKVPVDMGYPQSLEKEGQKMDLCGLP